MDNYNFLEKNGVILLNINGIVSNNLGYYETVKHLDNVLGKEVWICDYRNNEKDVSAKPIRNIPPTKVRIFDSDIAKKNIYYSPIFFREIKKDGSCKSTEIGPMDNSGFRCIAGKSINIFETKEECIECFQEQIKEAIRQKKLLIENVETQIQDLIHLRKY